MGKLEEEQPAVPIDGASTREKNGCARSENLVFMRVLFFLRDREVESHPDDDEEEEKVEENDDQQRLLQHHDAREAVLDVQVVDVALDEVRLAECDDWTPGDVQVREVEGVGLSLDVVRRDELQVLAALWQDDLHHQLIDHHVVENVIQDAHLQHVGVAVVEQVLEARDVVADRVVSAPAAEQREAWAEIQLDRVLQNLHGRGWDVAVGVAIINSSRRRRQDGLVVLDTGRAASRVLLVVIARERSLQQSSRVHDVDGLFDGHVAPVRNLNRSLQTSDGHEGRVVFVMDDNFSFGVG